MKGVRDDRSPHFLDLVAPDAVLVLGVGFLFLAGAPDLENALRLGNVSISLGFGGGGVAMAPNAHPHGGGEGRSPIGMPGPKTPWGKPALGYRTRKKNKPSSKFIVRKRYER